MFASVYSHVFIYILASRNISICLIFTSHTVFYFCPVSLYSLFHRRSLDSFCYDIFLCSGIAILHTHSNFIYFMKMLVMVNLFLAATKQLYKWYFPSVCPSVRLSICLSVRLSVTPFWLCSHHRIIMKFSGVITNDRRKVHAKGQGQRSKVKVTEVTTHLNRFRTVTPVWIHIWWRNDAYSLTWLRRGALLFFKVIHKISRSHGCKNRRIWPRLGVSGL